MCDFPEKSFNLPKWSCVLNFCSEFPGAFVTDVVINDEDDLNIPLIQFHHCKNISSCSFQKNYFMSMVKYVLHALI